MEAPQAPQEERKLVSVLFVDLVGFMQVLRTAVALADELVGQPARWQARAVLGEVARTIGDDDVAATVYGEAARLVETFVATLAPARAARLLAAPDVDQVLSLTGRRPAG